MTELICECGWVGKPNPHSDPPTCPGCDETGTLQEANSETRHISLRAPKNEKGVVEIDHDDGRGFVEVALGRYTIYQIVVTEEESADLEALAEALAVGDAAFTSEHGYSFLDQWLPTGDGREDVIKFVEAFTDYKVQRGISQRETGND